MMLLYRLIVAPTAVLVLPVIALFNEKIRQGLRMRMEPPPPPEFTTRPLWIHASSGEFEYAKAVIRGAKQRWPDIPIAVTYFSPTYRDAIRKFEFVDYHAPLPLDLPGPCSSLLRRLKPRALLIARTDLWPELLTQAHRLKIPTSVFSYTQKPITSPLRRWLTKWRLSHVDQVFCVSEADRAELNRLGVHAENLGDTRYDQVASRLSQPKPLPEHMKPVRPALIVGSSWTQDEQVVIEGLKDLLKEGRLQLILVPHEPSAQHIHELSQKVRDAGLSFALFSEGQPWTDKTTLIVDRVGILAELYTWADIAVIGGSFRGSVHSVMEAIGAGLMTIVGPHHLNNREAIEFQSTSIEDSISVVKCVANASQLNSYVTRILERPDNLKKRKASIKAEFGRKLGASARLLEALETALQATKREARRLNAGD